MRTAGSFEFGARLTRSIVGDEIDREVWAGDTVHPGYVSDFHLGANLRGVGGFRSLT